MSDDERAAGITFMAADQLREGRRPVLEIIQDQKDRLYRTRLPVPEPDAQPRPRRNSRRAMQWLRIIKDGKDQGYSYVVEEEAEKNKRAGVNIGVRSRLVENGEQTDAESFFFVAFDRSCEEWSTISQMTGKDAATGKETRRDTTELGVSTKVDRKILDVEGSEKWACATQKDKSNPPTITQSEYNLTVAYSGQSPVGAAAPAVVRLPQGLAHLIPRLVPLGEPKTYLFERLRRPTSAA